MPARPDLVLDPSVVQRLRYISQIKQVSWLTGDTAGREPRQLGSVHTDAHVPTRVCLAFLGYLYLLCSREGHGLEGEQKRFPFPCSFSSAGSAI